MSTANLLSVLMTAALCGLIGWHFLGDRRYLDAPADVHARRRRYRLSWEVRGLVLGVVGPHAAGIYFGYVSHDFTLPLLLFLATGLLVAEMIAPSGLRKHR